MRRDVFRIPSALVLNATDHYNYPPRSVRHQTAPLTQILSVTLSNSTSAQRDQHIVRVKDGNRNYQEAMLAAAMLRKHKARCLRKIARAAS